MVRICIKSLENDSMICFQMLINYRWLINALKLIPAIFIWREIGANDIETLHVK